MSTGKISLVVIFLEGLASFASPCVLPLLPVYLSYLAGASLEEIEKSNHLKRSMVLQSIGFVLGLSLVFIGLGATANALGRFMFEHGTLLRRISGIVIIIFGLHHAEIIKLKFLNYEKRMALQDRSPKFLNSVILGITFSFGWTPCIGPILGSVLMFAGNTDTVWMGMGFLAIYAMGLSLPFMVAALAINGFISHFHKIVKYFKVIKRISGVLLIIMGILVYTDSLYRLSWLIP